MNEPAYAVTGRCAGLPVPDVCDTFTVTRTWRVRIWRWQPRWMRWPARTWAETHGYRVTGWLRQYVPPPLEAQLLAYPEHIRDGMRGLLTRMDAEYPLPGHGPDEVPLVFCARPDAEYVCGAGVGGTIARLDEITPDGRVPWDEAAVAGAREHARLLIGERVF